MHVVIFLSNLNVFHKRQTVGCPKKFEENVVGENDADELALSNNIFFKLFGTSYCLSLMEHV